MGWRVEGGNKSICCVSMRRSVLDAQADLCRPIRDNGYKHALRIYRDRMTGAMRLQASVLHGPLKNTPIWTAFITHQITSPRWMRRAKNGHPTIYLADLKRHIFSAEYQAHIAASGEHILDFDVEKGTDQLLSCLPPLLMLIHTRCRSL